MPRSRVSHTPYTGMRRRPRFPGASPSCEVLRPALAGDGRLEDAHDTDPLRVTGLLVLDLDCDDARLGRLEAHGDLAVLARDHGLRDAGPGDLDLRSSHALLALGDLHDDLLGLAGGLERLRGHRH